MRPDEDVLAVEFKMNFLRPATGPLLVASAAVLQAGRTLVVCQVTVSATIADRSVPVAIMTQTNFRVPAAPSSGIEKAQS